MAVVPIRTLFMERGRVRRAKRARLQGGMIMGESENPKNIPPKVFRLSELLLKLKSDGEPWNELPPVCQEVQKTQEGKERCKDALEMIKSLLQESGDKVFASCCCYALKEIIFKISSEDAYLVQTRSLVPDYVHLSDVAGVLGKSVDYVEKELWTPVRPFDGALAKEMVEAVEQHAVKDKKAQLSPGELRMLSRQGEAVKALGRAYRKRFPQDHPAFDVVVYNMLKGSKLSNRGYKGLVETAVAVKVDEDLCIVRIIMNNLGPPSHEPPLPIIGMAFSGHGSPKECLKNELVGEFGRILLGEWKNAKWTKDIPLSAPDCRWEASVAIRLDNEPDAILLNDIKLAHKVAVNMAANTMGEFLLEALEEDPDHFRELLDRVTGPKVHSTEGAESSILWFQVLGDLKHASFAEPLRFKNDVLEPVFKVPERYSPLTPPVHEPGDNERWPLLRADLCDKGSRYRKAVDIGSIFHGLEISDGDKGRLTEYLDQYGIASVGGIADFIWSRRNRGDSEKEAGVWEATASFCEEKKNYDILKRLYEATLPAGPARALYYLRTEAFGMLVTGITAGRVPWYWVADRMGRNKARGFARQKVLAKGSG